MTTTQDLLADRYGRRGGSKSKYTRMLGLLAGASVLTAFLVWAWLSVSAQTNAVKVVSSGSKPKSALSFQVYGKVERPAAGVVRCALKVQALNFAVVGYREIELVAGTTAFDTTVFSFAPGVSASVQGCWVQ